MKKCSECGGSMKECINKTPEDIEYNYFKCNKCGEEIVDMKQLHNVAEKYKCKLVRIIKDKHLSRIEFEKKLN